MSIRVLVADDQQMVREGLAQMFKDEDITIVAEATTGKEVLELVEQHNPDVVLLDVRMPDGDGLNTLGRLRLDHPVLPILMFSHFDSPSYVARAAALGANGYLLKGATRKEVVEAVRKVAKGETTWTREQMRRVSGALTTPQAMRDVEAPLNDRELAVLKQMAEGMTNQQIAEALDMSYETVKEHIQQLLRKIGVTDRTQAAVWAVRKGLV